MTVVEQKGDGGATDGAIADAASRPAGGMRPDYDGRTGELAKILLVNSVLNLLTLGIFRFWARTRIRHFLWSHVAFAGDRFEYSGRGRELLIGFVVALVVVIPLAIVSALLSQFVAPLGPGYETAVVFTQYVVLIFLIGVAGFRARRYRLSRTAWRGIRGGQTGSALRYGTAFLGYSLLLVLTLGLALPLQRARLQRYLIDNTWFGDKRFRFDGRAGELFRIWIKHWLLLLPTIGLSYFWYRAAEYRYFAARTRYESLRFSSDLKGGRLFVIYLAYGLVAGLLFALFAAVIAMALMFFSVATGAGGAGPFANVDRLMGAATGAAALIVLLLIMGILNTMMVTHRLLRAICRSLTVVGEQDFAAIAQSRLAAPGRGEGLADAFDVGDF